MSRTHRASGRAVITREGHILLIRFKNGRYYNFPGGAVEDGETLAECTKREVFEETGFTVDVGEMLFTLEVETKRLGIGGDPHISVFYHCKIIGGVPKVIPCKPDHSPDDPVVPATAAWIPLDRLWEFNFLPYIPDNIIDYARTGIFRPSFLSGHFEKPNH